MEKKIVIKNKITLFQLVMISIIFFSIIAGILYMLFSQDYLSYRTRSNGWELIGFLFFVFPLLFSSFYDKKEYLSEIYIYSNQIKLVYKVQNKITREKIVDKDNIKSFNFDANIDVIQSGRYSRTDVSYKIFVDLIDGIDLNINDNSEVALVENNYNFVYKILDAARYIPNFNFNVESNNEIVRASIDYYRRFGKHLPFFTRLKMCMKMQPMWLNIILIICLLGFFISISFLLYLTIPVNLSLTEQQYIELIKNSYEYKNDYDKKFQELDKARNIISTDPYLYYLYAYNFKKKKDYYKAIDYAKQGISNLGNKEVYYKQYKYSKPKSDIYLYENLGDCYVKVGEFEKAIDAYTYVVNSKKKAKYSDIYFSRGRVYFELKMFSQAKNDFIKHKQIIKDYIKTYSGKEWKWADTYTEKHLANIDEWINACDAWIDYFGNK